MDWRQENMLFFFSVAVAVAVAVAVVVVVVAVAVAVATETPNAQPSPNQRRQPPPPQPPPPPPPPPPPSPSNTAITLVCVCHVILLGRWCPSWCIHPISWEGEGSCWGHPFTFLQSSYLPLQTALGHQSFVSTHHVQHVNDTNPCRLARILSGRHVPLHAAEVVLF